MDRQRVRLGDAAPARVQNSMSALTASPDKDFITLKIRLETPTMRDRL